MSNHFGLATCVHPHPSRCHADDGIGWHFKIESGPHTDRSPSFSIFETPIVIDNAAKQVIDAAA